MPLYFSNLQSFLSQFQFILYYLVPGYIMLKTVSTFIPVKRGVDIHFWLETILWSFIINAEIKVLQILPNTDWLSNYSRISTILTAIILALLTGFIIAKMKMSDWFKNILRKLFKLDQEPFANVWYAILNHNEGIYARIYLKEHNLIYDGIVTMFTSDPNQSSRELYISSFIKYSTDGTELENFEIHPDIGVLINEENISCVEIFYPESTQRLAEVARRLAESNQNTNES